MSDTAIKIEGLSKQYRLGQVGTGTISHDLNRWWHKVRGKEDPYLKIGETNDRTSKGESEYVWALKDIDFEVKKGEVLGIIGKNGAGKSTLLKLLSKVTAPTEGFIKANGRIASLLEVGTGFHPEMTGRENIYMNGTIMGMTKPEITRKLDEIVDFAGIERYLDTPAKRYSSGMTVRLGFAIAAHLEPEILIVDEVLAVGDAEFQKKAIGKMKDVSEGQGRTVLFVSHNMGSIEKLCNTGIILQNGQLNYTGTAKETVNTYMEQRQTQLLQKGGVMNFDSKNKTTYIKSIEILNSEGLSTNQLLYGEPFQIVLTIHSSIEVNGLFPLIGINNLDDTRISTNLSIDANKTYSLKADEEIMVTASYSDLILKPGDYPIVLALRTGKGLQLTAIPESISLNIKDELFRNTEGLNPSWGVISTNVNWS